MQELESRFVPIQTLYDAYARPYELWEVCIRILVHVTHDQQPDPTHLEALHDTYIRIVQDSYQQQPSLWPSLLKTKLESLASLFVLPPVAGKPKRALTALEAASFPVSVIVEEAERINTLHFADPGADAGPLPSHDATLKLLDRPEAWLIRFLLSDVVGFEYGHL